jgi:uncharacterized protein (DUF2147 family)
MRLSIGLITFLVASSVTTFGPHAETPVQGRWLTEEKTGVVEIYGCGTDTLCGRLLWFRIQPTDENPDTVDNRNPQPEMRRRKLCGLVMMWGFQRTGQNEWDGGSLYDPAVGQHI